MKQLLLFIIVIVSITPILTAQQTFTASVEGGFWSQGSSWEGGVSPGFNVNSNATVIIPAGRSVSLITSNFTNNGTIQLEGVLNISGSGNPDVITIINNGNITINSGGFLVYVNQDTSVFNKDVITNNGTFINSGLIDAPIITARQREFNNTLTGVFRNLNGTLRRRLNIDITNEGTIENTGIIEGLHSLTNNGSITNGAGNLTINPALIDANRPNDGIGNLDNLAGGTIVNAGTITIRSEFNSSEDFTAATNLGTITNQSGGTISIQRFLNALVSFTNDATLNNNGTLTINNASLTNNSQLNSTFSIINNGTLNNNATIQNTGGSIQNSGAFTNSGFGTLNNDITSSIVNTGTFVNNGQLINAGGGITNNAGTFTNVNSPATPAISATINTTGTITNNATFTNSFFFINSGTITNTANMSSQFMNNNGTFNNEGTFTVLTNGIVSRVTGTSLINNTGSLTVQSGAALSLPTATLSNTGTVSIEGSLNVSDVASVFNNNPGGQVTITGSANVNFGLLINDGAFTNNAGSTLTIDNGEFRNKGDGHYQLNGILTLNNSGEFDNRGDAFNNNMATVTNNGSILINGSNSIINNSGSFMNLGAIEFAINNGSGGILSNLPEGNLTNQGMIDLGFGGELSNFSGGNVINQAMINISSGGELSNFSTITNQASIIITGSGELITRTNSSVTNTTTGILSNGNNFIAQDNGMLINNGTLTGTNASHEGNFVNASTLSPGNSPGIYSFTNAYTHQNTANLNIEIQGASIPGTDYDQILVAESVLLAGTLTVSLPTGYEPQVGETFTIITGNAVSGTFDDALFPDLINEDWQINYTPTSVILEIIPALRLATSLPDINALNVNNSTDIALTFNQNIDPTSITNSSIKISGNYGVPLTFSNPIVTGAGANIDPNRDFFPGETITTTLTTGILNTVQESLRKPFTYQYTAAANPNSPGTFPIIGHNLIVTDALATVRINIADIDNDGDLDVVSCSSDSRLFWHKNDGTGNFTQQPNISSNAQFISEVTFGDLDGDANLDILVNSISDSRIIWFKNDGVGNFTQQPNINSDISFADNILTADLDGDGDIDVITTSSSFQSSRITWFKNGGSGNFTSQPDISSNATGFSDLTIGDLDGDGDIDVLAALATEGKVNWYENDGIGNFGASQNITTSTINTVTVNTADLDNDGDLDVFSSNSFANGELIWYKNDGSGTFTQQSNNTSTPDDITDTATADLDGDGYLDIISRSLSTFESSIAWHKNNGAGIFTRQPNIVTAGLPSSFNNSFTTGDLDGDGDIDVIDQHIIWYKNVLPLCAGGTTTYTAMGWNNGIPDATMTAIIANDYNTSTIGLGDITACELIINAGATLIITDGNSVSVENNITINGTLDVSNEGSIVQVQEDAMTINNGSIAVAKTTPTLDDRNFVTMSSPVTAEARDRVYGNSRAVFSIIPSNFVPFVIDFMVFPEFEFAENFLDDNNDYLLPVTGSTATPAAGIGQLIFPQPEPNVGDGAYTLTYIQNPSNPGTLNSGTISVPINYNGPATTNNYNLLGNPYASAIDVTAFINANDAVNEVYYWDHITNPTSDLPGFGTSNFSMNDISIRNAMMGIAAVNGGTPPGQFMASGQGFGIKADQAEMVAGTPVVFTNSIRVTGNNDGFRNSETQTGVDKLWLNLTSTAFDEAIAQTGIGFTPNATPAIDKGYDSPRVGTFLSLFTTLASGEFLGIQAREAFDPEMEIALGFSTSIEEVTPYTISIGNLEGIAIENATVFIIDHLLNTIVNLSEQSYTFTAQKGLHTDRFTIVFQDRDVLNTDEESFRESVITLYPNPSQGQVTLAYTGTSTLENVLITDINGKIIKRIDLTNFNQSQTMDVSDLAKGMYFMQITSQGNTVTKKLILR
ncbi:FG-GAP-like repeat-containing protein [uncultured Dokdonia sp.]|uniref:FG-GAP-like repeat-containing protein n=1 Tax=uncultured Dokdonia sp. TaxID=575653 RepID=UPI00263793AF|nr:FG-GAP-like repeat-containing protein [uncultured Dokdonia sp.]